MLLRLWFLGLPALALSSLLFQPAQAQKAAEKLSGVSLKSTMQGRTVYLATSYGITVPIRYRSNGTMSASAPGFAKIIGYSDDSGTWWVNKDGICQRWRKWQSGQTRCYRITRKGKTIHYVSSSGARGTVRIK